MQKLIDDGVQVDSIITDPPYHLTSIVKRYSKENSAPPTSKSMGGAFVRVSKGFMGKEWDGGDIAFRPETWELALKLLKPGGYVLAFSASRNYHRMAVAIEDAGFEIRDQMMWLYGSGFPKSLNIGKGVDKKQGNDREDLGNYKTPDGNQELSTYNNWKDGEEQERRTPKITKGNSEYEGWGTALKPAHEPIVMARKPLSEKSIVDNVLKHGVGGINIDGCRIEGEVKHPPNNPDFRDAAKQAMAKGGVDKLSFGQDRDAPIKRKTTNRKSRSKDGVWTDGNSGMKAEGSQFADADPKGRFPANVMHGGLETEWAKYFYCPKVSKAERNQGLEDFPVKKSKGGGGTSNDTWYEDDVNSASGKFGSEKAPSKTTHPTVKPQELMKYLCRMVTPKGGTVLDIFMGSGSTGMAAKDEGFDFIGIERDKEYFNIAEKRIKITAPLSEFME